MQFSAQKSRIQIPNRLKCCFRDQLTHMISDGQTYVIEMETGMNEKVRFTWRAEKKGMFLPSELQPDLSNKKKYQ